MKTSLLLMLLACTGCNHLRTTVVTLGPDGKPVAKTEVIRDTNPMGKTQGNFRFRVNPNGSVDIEAKSYSNEAADSWATVISQLSEAFRTMAETAVRSREVTVGGE